MAGNLVKWWKHKILGGYKQFSVQECPTDSEELMYHHQVRASSSCSAPPDLLLVNDRENNVPLRSDVGDVFGGTRTPPPNSVNACPDLAASVNNIKKTNQNQHQQQKQQPQTQLPQNAHTTSHIYNNSNIDSGKKVNGSKQGPPHFDIDGHGEKQQNFSTARQTHHQHQPRSEEHIRLEEFTCDVSVEGGKSSQPLQFSFTFYDLDGHHGKITKDDIVGIVYTIYESIGKSVVVPHSGSKTINVRLTVSPEGKSKLKKQQNVASQKDGVITTARRLHRYRARHLIKSDEDDDDSNSEKEREGGATATTNVSNHIATKASKNSRVNKAKADQQCCQQPQQCMDVNNHERVFEHPKKVETGESCRECLTAAESVIRKATTSPTRHSFASAGQFPSKSVNNDAYMKHIASTRIKMLRKSRKQKYQDCMETRQRSLSVGSESCWNNRHLIKSTQHPAMCNADPCFNGSDILDGVQMRNPLRSEKQPMAQKRNSAECWKSALNRNDLISIIRESMEKNRLCFQLNGKPQANVSPIRQTSGHHHISQRRHAERQATQHHRQRSNTVSKIPMLIANHSNRYSSISNNNDLSPSEHLSNISNSNNIYHQKPHIPIYDTNVPINPIALSPTHVSHVVRNSSGPVAHNKANLCGYDSFLHATICGGGLGDSPPSQVHSQPGLAASSPHSLHQQIATVQPIMSSLGSNVGLSLTPNQIRTSKILRSGSYSQAHQAALTAQNSPQQHGYQRLCSSNRAPPNVEKTQLTMLEKVRKDQAKYYDQLLYAKLTEKLQQTNLATTNKENMERRRHRVLRHRRSSFSVPEANKVCVSSVPLSKANDFSSFLPIGADPIECENLIVPTSDDDCHSHHSIETNNDQRETEVASSGVLVGTLVNLDDNHRDIKTDAANQTISNAMLDLNTDGNIDIKIQNEVVVEEEMNEELDDGEDIGMKKSGHESAASNEENDDTVANANSVNASATSSLIHRYVHEHIHHHYHHFEDKDE